MFDVFRIARLGKRRAISTSKIKKITAMRKKRVENGNRADLFGSNPHSNGEFFSRSMKVFFESVVASMIIMRDNEIIIIAIFNMMIIIYFELSIFLIGSQMYYYTK